MKYLLYALLLISRVAYAVPNNAQNISQALCNRQLGLTPRSNTASIKKIWQQRHKPYLGESQFGTWNTTELVWLKQRCLYFHEISIINPTYCQFLQSEFLMHKSLCWHVNVFNDGKVLVAIRDFSFDDPKEFMRNSIGRLQRAQLQMVAVGMDIVRDEAQREGPSGPKPISRATQEFAKNQLECEDKQRKIML